MSNSTQNIISYFRSFFIPNKTQGYVNGPQTTLVPFSIGSLLNIFPSVDTQRAITEGFDGNATVYSIARDTGKKFGSIPRCIYQDINTQAVKKGFSRFRTKQITFSEPADLNNKNIAALASLLNRPNPTQGQDAFFETLMISYLITGEGFIYLNRGYLVNGAFEFINSNGTIATDDQLDALPILEMYFLPANLMTLIPDPNDVFNYLGWVFIYQGYQLFIRKNDIIQWKTSTLNWDVVTRTHLRGQSPLRAGGGILQQNTAAVLSSIRTFQNDGARGILSISTPPEAIAPGQESQVRQVVDKKINSANAGGSVATLFADAKYLDLSKPEHLPLMDGMRYSDQQLCMLLGMPYEMIQSGTTFSNKQMAMKNWINNTIIPLAKQLDDELNRVLLKVFGLVGKVCIVSEFRNLPELQDDMLSLAQSLAQMPFLTMNEKRQAAGYDPYPDPLMDEPMIPTGILPISAVKDEIDQINQPITTDYNNPDIPVPTK